jgi:hypothetical protein
VLECSWFFLYGRFDIVDFYRGYVDEALAGAHFPQRPKEWDLERWQLKHFRRLQNARSLEVFDQKAAGHEEAMTTTTRS